jgi:hypothetical protein
MEASSNDDFMLLFTTPAFPQGTTVYASVALSFVNTNDPRPDPHSFVFAYIPSWSVYRLDGTIEEIQASLGFDQNSVAIENCATITFRLWVSLGQAIAQINVFSF